MLKISIREARDERRLVLEGKLIAPWTAEVRAECEKAGQNLAGRTLVLDLKNLTVISEEGENLLGALMNEGVKFHGGGVLANQILRQLAKRDHALPPESKP
jgi:hypothetical protein